MKKIVSKYRNHSETSESKEHKGLKEYVKKKPNSIKLLNRFDFKSKEGSVEHTFKSNDAVDVFFQNNKNTIGVEVKGIKSDDSDLLRGIFQCVKYKALLNAELLTDSKFPNADCFLITQRELNGDLKLVAKQLDVKYETVKIT